MGQRSMKNPRVYTLSGYRRKRKPPTAKARTTTISSHTSTTAVSAPSVLDATSSTMPTDLAAAGLPQHLHEMNSIQWNIFLNNSTSGDENTDSKELLSMKHEAAGSNSRGSNNFSYTKLYKERAHIFPNLSRIGARTECDSGPDHHNDEDSSQIKIKDIVHKYRNVKWSLQPQSVVKLPVTLKKSFVVNKSYSHCTANTYNNNNKNTIRKTARKSTKNGLLSNETFNLEVENPGQIKIHSNTNCSPELEKDEEENEMVIGRVRCISEGTTSDAGTPTNFKEDSLTNVREAVYIKTEADPIETGSAISNDNSESKLIIADGEAASEILMAFDDVEVKDEIIDDSTFVGDSSDGTIADDASFEVILARYAEVLPQALGYLSLQMADTNSNSKESLIKSGPANDTKVFEYEKLDVASLKDILSKHPNSLLEAISHLTSQRTCHSMTLRSTKAVTITAAANNSNNHGNNIIDCTNEESEHSTSFNKSIYEVNIATSTNTFSVSPVLRPKLEPRNEPLHCTEFNSVKSEHGLSSRINLSLPTSVATILNDVVSDKELYSDESSEEDWEDNHPFLERLHRRRKDIGVQNYKPAVIHSSSGVVVSLDTALNRNCEKCNVVSTQTNFITQWDQTSTVSPNESQCKKHTGKAMLNLQPFLIPIPRKLSPNDQNNAREENETLLSSSMRDVSGIKFSTFGNSNSEVLTSSNSTGNHSQTGTQSLLLQDISSKIDLLSPDRNTLLAQRSVLVSVSNSSKNAPILRNVPSQSPDVQPSVPNLITLGLSTAEKITKLNGRTNALTMLGVVSNSPSFISTVGNADYTKGPAVGATTAMLTLVSSATTGPPSIISTSSATLTKTPPSTQPSNTFLFQPAYLPGTPKPPMLLIRANSAEDVQNLLQNKKIIIRPNVSSSSASTTLILNSNNCAATSTETQGIKLLSTVTETQITSLPSSASSHSTTSHKVTGDNSLIKLDNNANNLECAPSSFCKKEKKNSLLMMYKTLKRSAADYEHDPLMPVLKKSKVVLSKDDIVNLKGKTTINLNEYFKNNEALLEKAKTKTYSRWKSSFMSRHPTWKQSKKSNCIRQKISQRIYKRIVTSKRQVSIDLVPFKSQASSFTQERLRLPNSPLKITSSSCLSSCGSAATPLSSQLYRIKLSSNSVYTPQSSTQQSSDNIIAEPESSSTVSKPKHSQPIALHSSIFTSLSSSSIALESPITSSIISHISPIASLLSPTTTFSSPIISLSSPITSLSSPNTALSSPTTSLSSPTTSLSSPTTSISSPTISISPPTTSLSPPTTSLSSPMTSLSSPTTSLSSPPSLLSSVTSSASSGMPPISPVGQSVSLLSNNLLSQVKEEPTTYDQEFHVAATNNNFIIIPDQNNFNTNLNGTTRYGDGCLPYRHRELAILKRTSTEFNRTYPNICMNTYIVHRATQNLKHRIPDICETITNINCTTPDINIKTSNLSRASYLGTIPDLGMTTPYSIRISPNSSVITSDSSRTTITISRTPDSSRALTDSSRALPDSSRALPDSSGALLDSSGALLDSSRALPDSSRALPDSSRTTPQLNGIACDLSRIIADSNIPTPDESLQSTISDRSKIIPDVTSGSFEIVLNQGFNIERRAAAHALYLQSRSNVKPGTEPRDPLLVNAATNSTVSCLCGPDRQSLCGGNCGSTEMSTEQEKCIGSRRRSSSSDADQELVIDTNAGNPATSLSDSKVPALNMTGKKRVYSSSNNNSKNKRMNSNNSGCNNDSNNSDDTGGMSVAINTTAINVSISKSNDKGSSSSGNISDICTTDSSNNSGNNNNSVSCSSSSSGNITNNTSISGNINTTSTSGNIDITNNSSNMNTTSSSCNLDITTTNNNNIGSSNTTTSSSSTSSSSSLNNTSSTNSMSSASKSPSTSTMSTQLKDWRPGELQMAFKYGLKAEFDGTSYSFKQDTMSFEPIYLDYNATTPVAAEVQEVVSSTMSKTWGNPSSSHCYGKDAARVVEKARNQVAMMLGARHENIIFTSGGTEANNLAIHSAIKHYRNWAAKSAPPGHPLHDTFKQPHIITSNLEHDSVRRVLNVCDDIDVSVVGWEKMPAAVVSSIKPNTCLITIMLANNETGIMLPVAQITRLMNEDVRKTREIERLFRILTHTDASQCVGKVAVEVDDLGVDYLTITGHKFYGPRIGALYIRENSQGFLPVYPQFYGGGQERGIRPGTENTPMIAGLGMACELVYSNLYDYASQLKKQRSYLERLLKRHFSEHIKFNCLVPCTEDDPVGCASRHLSGKKETPLVYPRLPNTCSAALCYPQVTAAEILQLCPNLLCSQGAACHSDDNVAYENSILKQHGVCSFHAKRTLRLSIGRETTHQDLESAVLQIKLAVQSLLNKNKAMINNS